MSQQNHIAVIRLSALGDVAMTVPVLRVLCATYPNLKITVVSRVFFKPLFDELPNVEFFEAEVKGRHQGIKGLLLLSKELKRNGVTAIADLHNVLRSHVVRAYFKTNFTPVAKIDKGRKEKKALTRAHNKIYKQLPTTFERYAAVFEHLNFPIDLSRHEFPKRKVLTEASRAYIDKTRKKHIGIAPFAAFKGKMYPLSLMKEVIDTLAENTEIQLLLFGGGTSEKETLDTIASHYENVTSLVDKLSFEDELAIIANLDAMIAMDSGNAHLSAIYNVPTITLWGVTHPFLGFYPFQQPLENALQADKEKFPLIPTSVYGNKLPKDYEKAMETILPKKVVEKVKHVLQQA